MSDEDSIAFRNALGVFATGVTIITAHDAETGDAAITANSFNSVSLDPPLVLWSVAKSSTSLPVFIAAGHYVVHILNDQQQKLSNQYARSGEQKFDPVDHERANNGCIVLPQCAAYFQCQRHQAVEAGDHWIFIVRVNSFSGSNASPLIYHRGQYARLESDGESEQAESMRDWTW
jgi:flavin reductase (DIM6/NTAB) family NADH-FMN oxidoreductase RutF